MYYLFTNKLGNAPQILREHSFNKRVDFHPTDLSHCRKMVVCRFFLQGTCRFGTKCNNEHLDIKQLVKSDLEAALNGKQWPLSCFGPFKDKPCVPSFIEDHSFEEIRWLCYEAKQKNCLDQYVQHFSKEVVEANTKMKALLQLSPQIVDIICRLYDAQTDTAPNVGLLKNDTNNPFSLGSHATNETPTLFGKSGPSAGFIGGFNNVSTSNTGNVFGNLTTSPARGIFGGGNVALNQNSQASIFSQQTPKTNSIFGGGNSQTGLFGQTQANAGTMGGLFGQTPQPNVGLFGQQVQNPETVQPGGLFAQNQTQGGGSIFNQGMQHQNPPNSGNIFAQAVQPQQTQNSTSFAIYQGNKQQAASVFGQQNAFAQQNSNGIFGQMATTPAATNMFGQPVATTNASGIFTNTNPTSVPTQSIFGQALQQQAPVNIFSQPSQASPAVGSTMQSPAGLFQQTSLTQNVNTQPSPFGQQMVGNNLSQPLLQSPVVSSSIYSKLEDLSPEDIEAFKADLFTPGRIPNAPPPRELIN